jgi:hypothetical protein
VPRLKELDLAKGIIFYEFYKKFLTTTVQVVILGSQMAVILAMLLFRFPHLSRSDDWGSGGGEKPARGADAAHHVVA